MKDLEELAHSACQAAVEAGAEFVDVSAYRGRNVGIELEDDAIKSCDARWQSGVSVRVFVQGARGWASSSGLDPDEAVRAARNAADLAKVAEPDPDFVTLPGPADYPSVDGLFDPKLETFDVQELIRYLVENIEAAHDVDPDVSVNGGAGTSWSESVLVNNLGVDAASRSTYIGLNIWSIVKRGDDVGSYYEYGTSRVLEDLEPGGIGTKATQEAVRSLGARKIGTGTLPVILGPQAAHDTLSSLCGAANAEDIQRNRSWLAGRKGERIASELVTLVDDPTVPRGLSSSVADGEGFPRKRLTVIDRGVLASWLHNSYTANKAGEPNTGHSTRGGIAPTNVNPGLGDVTAADIIRDTQEGLYLPQGGVQPNQVSGDFSSSVDTGFKIENGEIAYPVKNTMIAGNMLEFLANIDAVSSDYREEPGCIMPTIRIKEVRVAGGE